MNLDRDKLIGALFDRLKSSVPMVKTFQRPKRGFVQFDGAHQPALVLVAGNQTPHQTLGMPTSWRIGAHVIVYAATNDDATLLGLLDQVEKSLEVKPGEEGDGVHTTLGGLVKHCWISGVVEIYEGTTAEQAMLVIPVEMLAVA